MLSLITRFMGPTRGPSGADRTQVGPMLAPWILLSGVPIYIYIFRFKKNRTWNEIWSKIFKIRLPGQFYIVVIHEHPRYRVYSVKIKTPRWVSGHNLCKNTRSFSHQYLHTTFVKRQKYKPRYVDGMPTSGVTPVTIRYFRPPHHGHTCQYH